MSNENEEIVIKGDKVQFTDGPFTHIREIGELIKVDHRSATYPFLVRVPNGEGGKLEIPCARWEFTKI